MIAAVKQQMKDLKAEVIDRVDWPKPDRVRQATYAVVAVSIFTGVYLWVADLFFGYLHKWLMPIR